MSLLTVVGFLQGIWRTGKGVGGPFYHKWAGTQQRQEPPTSIRSGSISNHGFYPHSLSLSLSLSLTQGSWCLSHQLLQLSFIFTLMHSPGFSAPKHSNLPHLKTLKHRSLLELPRNSQFSSHFSLSLSVSLSHLHS